MFGKEENLLDRKFVKNENIVSRKIMEETILIPVVSQAENMQSIYTLNDASTFIWERMDGNHSLKEILQKLLEEYEVSEEEAKKDLLEFTKDLLEIGAIKEVKR